MRTGFLSVVFVGLREMSMGGGLLRVSEGPACGFFICTFITT